MGESQNKSPVAWEVFGGLQPPVFRVSLMLCVLLPRETLLLMLDFSFLPTLGVIGLSNFSSDYGEG